MVRLLCFWALAILSIAGALSHSADTDKTPSAQSNFFPTPITPQDNPSSTQKIALGKKLFHETRLSLDNTYSCASCHQPNRHFTDGLSKAIGVTGEQHSLNTPTLYNTGFNASLGWQDTGITELEQQHLVPLLNTHPIEMGYSNKQRDVIGADKQYQQAFEGAFADQQISLENIVRALASYVRTIRPPTSAFDNYLFQDDSSALSKEAKAGLELFFSERLSCSHCHASLNFSGPIKHSLSQAAPVFHVTGVGGSNKPFRAPTLRAIRHTAPYMHDGSLTTFTAVIDHYENTRVERLAVFELSQQERSQLIAFLQSL